MRRGEGRRMGSLSPTKRSRDLDEVDESRFADSSLVPSPPRKRLRKESYIGLEPEEVSPLRPERSTNFDSFLEDFNVAQAQSRTIGEEEPVATNLIQAPARPIGAAKPGSTFNLTQADKLYSAIVRRGQDYVQRLAEETLPDFAVLMPGETREQATVRHQEEESLQGLLHQAAGALPQPTPVKGKSLYKKGHWVLDGPVEVSMSPDMGYRPRGSSPDDPFLCKPRNTIQKAIQLQQCVRFVVFNTGLWSVEAMWAELRRRLTLTIFYGITKVQKFGQENGLENYNVWVRNEVAGRFRKNLRLDYAARQGWSKDGLITDDAEEPEAPQLISGVKLKPRKDPLKAGG